MYPNCLYHIPDSISFEEATLLEPAANAYKAVIQEGGLHAGETVVVFGAGALGLMSVQIAAIGGAANIVLVGRESDKVTRFAVGKKFGATHTMTSGAGEGFIGEIHKIAGEGGVALVIDAAGVPTVTTQAIKIVRNEGMIVRIGMSEKPYNENLDSFAMKSVTIRGHMGYNTESWRNILALVRAGKIDLASIIHSVLPLEEFQKGFELMRSQEAAKVILAP